MAILKEQKEQIIKHFQKKELDTGSSAVQVALLTFRILDLQDHFKKNKKDHHGRLGLVKMVNKRRKLLSYVKRKDVNAYAKLISELGLRK